MPYATIFHDTMLVPPRWFGLRIGPEKIGVDRCRIGLLLLAWEFGVVLVVALEVKLQWWWTTKTRRELSEEMVSSWPS